jgi:sulfur relay (sulfurtransferase) complex TusBCD TusD component (DsrE family)
MHFLKPAMKFKSFFSAKRFLSCENQWPMQLFLLAGHRCRKFWARFVTKKIPIYACGACSRARGVNETDLTEYGAKFGNPKIFVSLVEWADKIITD